ncbi:GIY-YIG nuclease family protein [Patescibacteria group bacterium]|nr:GIY-YIG nuclease family protein [Patescibacteria group bacterium]MBU1922461.1 GIY-YIG nuclease family protein [Patescibacteria group bacterium]
MPFTYILKSLKVKNWHYVGSCISVLERIKQHQKGSVRSTKSKRPLTLAWKKEFKTITEARKFENYLKSPKGYLEKKRIINQNNKKVPR